MLTIQPSDDRRDKWDRDYSPSSLGKACVDVLPVSPRQVEVCLDPCIGGGAFAHHMVRRFRSDCLSVDIDPYAPGLKPVPGTLMGQHVVPVQEDFLAMQPHPGEHYEVAASNPPFSLAEAFVRHTLQFAPVVGFLLLASFIESKERAAFWEEFPASYVYFLRERPSFIRIKDGEVVVDNKTDSRMYAFFIWERRVIEAAKLGGGHPSPTLRHLDWDKPSASALRAEAYSLCGQQSLFAPPPRTP